MCIRDSAAEEMAQARSAAQQYERITSTFPVTDTTTENLKVTVVEFQRIAERTATPERALAHVSRVLDKNPQFDLDDLKWLSLIHISEPTRLLSISYAVFCLKK